MSAYFVSDMLRTTKIFATHHIYLNIFGPHVAPKKMEGRESLRIAFINL